MSEMTQIDMFSQNWRENDPVTSVQAAVNVNATGRRSQKTALLVCYAKRGSGGLTDEEAAKLAEIKSPCPWRRCSDLRAVGLIERTSETRRSTMGELQSVCRITQAGFDELARLGISW